MSNTQYHCEELQRRKDVIVDGTLNGIDFLEVASTDQLTLRLGLFLSASTLTPDNFKIEGGVRVLNIVVENVTGQPGKTLKLTVSARGDYSIYTLRIVKNPDTDDPPADFDPQLSAVDFSFKVECPNDFDCKEVQECPPAVLPQPEIDYLAKDYSSFRRLMFDRLSVLMPDWRERNPADVQVTLVELLAYVADHLSYSQDAVATEAYLGTARSRISLRRHARLLDYRIGEGCNARAFVALRIAAAADGKVLPGPKDGQGTQFFTRLTNYSTLVETLPTEAEREAIVFESLHDLTLIEAHNEISFYTWSDSSCCLPQGATRATLENNGLALAPGDLLLFEEIRNPETGLEVDADPTHRHVVRLETVDLTATDPLTKKAVAEITWRREDALPFPFCLSARVKQGSSATTTRIAVARGNIVLADHGRTVVDEELDPLTVPEEGNYRPVLPLPNLTFAAPFDPEVVIRDEVTHAIETVTPAATALEFAADQATPAISLKIGNEIWTARQDLFNSDRFAPEFVVEMERDGVAHLRFGDNELGKRPPENAQFTLSFRVGLGVTGNIGAEALRHVVAETLVIPPDSILEVRNPLPAIGGVAPESFEQARQFAPQAFRRQERAVTEADWAEVAQRFPEVQRAAATFRWTGSWYTVFVTIDRLGGVSAAKDSAFKTALRAHLEQYRIAGYDLEVTDPVYVPLDILMLVCVRPGYLQSDIRAALQKLFSRQQFADGSLAFFHPDNFTFGQALYLSHVYAAAMKVPGIASVQVKTFQRLGFPPNHELANGLISAARLEILRLDNDPNFPENGKIEFELHGGL